MFYSLRASAPLQIEIGCGCADVRRASVQSQHLGANAPEQSQVCHGLRSPSNSFSPQVYHTHTHTHTPHRTHRLVALSDHVPTARPLVERTRAALKEIKDAAAHRKKTAPVFLCGIVGFRKAIELIICVRLDCSLRPPAYLEPSVSLRHTRARATGLSARNSTACRGRRRGSACWHDGCGMSENVLLV